MTMSFDEFDDGCEEGGWSESSTGDDSEAGTDSSDGSTGCDANFFKRSIKRRLKVAEAGTRGNPNRQMQHGSGAPLTVFWPLKQVAVC